MEIIDTYYNPPMSFQQFSVDGVMGVDFDAAVAMPGCSIIELPDLPSGGLLVINIFNISGGDLQIDPNIGASINGNAILKHEQHAVFFYDPLVPVWDVLFNTSYFHPIPSRVSAFWEANGDDTNVVNNAYTIIEGAFDGVVSTGFSVGDNDVTYTIELTKSFSADVSLSAIKTTGGNNNQEYYISIFVNGIKVSGSMTGSLNKTVLRTLGINAILQLSTGDTVDVRIEGTSNGDVNIRDFQLRLIEI